MTKESRDWLNEQFMGDEKMISFVWDEYLKSMREKLDKSRAALAASDCLSLDRLAHSMKGDALLVGESVAVQAAVALRDAAKASDVESAAAALDRIVAALERAAAE